MGEGTKIAWAHHSLNAWWGCTRVSPGCGGAKGVGGCYAEAFAKRLGLDIWGQDKPRKFMSEKYWREPLRWDAAAAKAGERHRVFCSSMADLFEDYRGPSADGVREARSRVFHLLEATPHLDWLLLTKRPENVMRMVPPLWQGGFPRNVWMGTTCEDQQRADERIPHLLRCPAAVRWVSYEPALGAVNFRHIDADAAGHPMCQIDALTGQQTDMGRPCPDVPRLDWIVVGGESGPGARPFHAEWARDTIRQCREAGAACFTKQMGARPVWCSACRGRGAGLGAGLGAHECPECGGSGSVFGEPGEGRPTLTDRAGADPAEWPAELRVREFPEVSP